MERRAQQNMPQVFQHLHEMGCLPEERVFATADGFFAAAVSLADILACRGITSVPGRNADSLDCRLFFDDWYLYAVMDGTEQTCSLYKMREQEYDAKMGLRADGDTPGVSIAFITMQTEILLRALQEPTDENKRRLNDEINRVAADGGQRHSEALKRYFIRTQAQGTYLIAKLYTDYLASLACGGVLAVPERYAADYQKRGLRGRVPQFLERNNEAAGRTICDHKAIFLCDPQHLTEHERLAILAAHTGNVSVFSFAAEVRFHARFLTWWAKIPIPVIGRSPYASAIRADMSIGDAEMTGPTPYYRLNSRTVRAQERCGRAYMEEYWL